MILTYIDNLIQENSLQKGFLALIDRYRTNGVSTLRDIVRSPITFGVENYLKYLRTDMLHIKNMVGQIKNTATVQEAQDIILRANPSSGTLINRLISGQPYSALTDEGKKKALLLTLFSDSKDYFKVARNLSLNEHKGIIDYVYNNSNKTPEQLTSYLIGQLEDPLVRLTSSLDHKVMLAGSTAAVYNTFKSNPSAAAPSTIIPATTNTDNTGLYALAAIPLSGLAGYLYYKGLKRKN